MRLAASMAQIGKLCDQDLVLWAEQQAAALRHAKNSNLPLDWDNLAEEIASLGKSQRTELNSQIRRVPRHLFKLGASSAAGSTSWMARDNPRRASGNRGVAGPMNWKATANLPTAPGRNCKAADFRPSRCSQTGLRTPRVKAGRL